MGVITEKKKERKINYYENNSYQYKKKPFPSVSISEGYRETQFSQSLCLEVSMKDLEFVVVPPNRVLINKTNMKIK